MLMSKYRLDDFSLIKRLVLRMFMKIHKQFSYSLTRRITEQLRLLSYKTESTANFVKNIRDVLSIIIRPRNLEYKIHNSDSFFQYLKSISSKVIVKIVHLQEKKKTKNSYKEIYSRV